MTDLFSRRKRGNLCANSPFSIWMLISIKIPDTLLR